jgi:thiol:disulfide interchange protein
MQQEGLKSVFQRIVTHPVFLMVTAVVMVLLIVSTGGAIFQIFLPKAGRTDFVSLLSTNTGCFLFRYCLLALCAFR